MKLNPSIKNMSNEYIFFTDQTALTFRICLVYTYFQVLQFHLSVSVQLLLAHLFVCHRNYIISALNDAFKQHAQTPIIGVLLNSKRCTK